MKRNEFVYRLARFIVLIIAKTVFRLKVTGKENIPSDGSLLVCANHSSNWDPVFLVSAIPTSRSVRYMAKEELFNIPVLKQIMISAGTYPVGRGQGDRQALKRTIELLNSDETVGIFPEGTRSAPGEFTSAQPGVGFFALRSPAQILPIAIIGDYRPFRRMRVAIGKPVDISDLRDQRGAAKAISERILEEVKTVYFNHA
ncbi:1-acyl-sn-glycerol-3-phosphate acyltransferase [Exiguobacterium sp. PvP048]|uniref:Phospholipid/glycerol acyltransferase n=1 Tax=Exiguobacterium sibiricum (strain DSM 17290 / CCUG 55495 / CIP 109462 / JCM 13490 / 255-15) TaxID=262543 RepID=B1YI32_EXIS2|nr:lysophospholipid acyltransferase family protein [Exiguobacterium sibiricum]ACB61259.1 phospholipid/glycerol acyltransferase [Exiguobacterium sibiricum 255-15]